MKIESTDHRVWHVTRYDADNTDNFARGSGYKSFEVALAQFTKLSTEDPERLNARWALEVTCEVAPAPPNYLLDQREQ